MSTKNKIDTSIFFLRLEKKLTEMGIKKRNLAKQIGVSDQAISRWGSGTQPKPENIARAAEVLQCDAEWLAGKGEDHEMDPRIKGLAEKLAYIEKYDDDEFYRLAHDIATVAKRIREGETQEMKKSNTQS